MNIEIISSSPRQSSLTYRLALHLQKNIETKKEHNVGIIDVREWNLGLLQNVFSTIENTPEKYKSLAEKVFAADAWSFFTNSNISSYYMKHQSSEI